MKKPKKKEVKGIKDDYGLLPDTVTDFVNLGYNQAIDDYEPYIKELLHRTNMAEEKAREQYQQKWDIINGLPSEEEIEDIVEKTYCRLYEFDSEEIAKAIFKRIGGKK